MQKIYVITYLKFAQFFFSSHNSVENYVLNFVQKLWQIVFNASLVYYFAIIYWFSLSFYYYITN